MPELNERVSALEERTQHIQLDVKEIKDSQAEMLRCLQSIKQDLVVDKGRREGEAKVYAKIASIAGVVASAATAGAMKILGH